MAARTLGKELKKVREYGLRGAEASPVGDNLFKWNLILDGPEDSPYEGGKFKIEVDFPDNYPFVPPKLRFKTTIYHPSVNKETGKICTDLIADQWKPTLGLRYIVQTLRSVLEDPSSDRPVEPKIAMEYEKAPRKFHKTARQYTKMYAR
mmetsp:Transcript_16404/g.18557  ORF Transcript_16404/g.18557 Transcript_16404/m.18557 type:complete len:149 (-) Transcript_16404:1170-1616(-)|eukprot:CAMPEP_0184018608 /NCGR_PEP_ID=MMETSP0954-20121128/8244_1 /TAXON_ID=627963 /ORGANISM="Aplanochytrium sp, Strain PBS07" /LENGTH=148 /DNA_ID=CAMNT_0026300089 /DNA_START=284 /DNA_END=730 /DNA_ORIENTATION=+